MGGRSPIKEQDPRGALRARIMEHVAGKITAGEWGEGDLVPSERELMNLFAASRMTVHHALRELTSRGFLLRRRGAGTFVAPPRPYAARYDHLDIVSEIEARGGVHSAKVLRRVIRAPTPAEAEEFGSEEPLFHAKVLHLENGDPVELEDRLLDPVATPNCVTVDLTQRSLFSVLMLVRPYREGSETVRPILPSKMERELLKVRAGTPALEVTRKTWTDVAIVTVARLLRVRESGVLSGRISSSDLP
jgi:GntR family histidine utilization transcriptional repressor